MHLLYRTCSQRINSTIILKNVRNCCYKPINRPKLNAQLKSNFAAKISAERDSSISSILKTKIAASPIPVAEYMKTILTNPDSGYYMMRDMFGEKGDFITSPEISQIFSEIVAIWCISEWRKCSSSKPFQIVEFGPGRGTLSQDILRVFAEFGLSDKFSMHLIEVSPFLSEYQAKKICCHHRDTKEEDLNTVPYYRRGESVSGVEIYWYRELSHVPKAFSIYLAHEFFDALPIHKFQKIDGNWREVLIDLDQNKEDHFRFITSKSMTPMLNTFLARSWINKNTLPDQFEYCAEAEQIIDELASRVEESGGISLIMDYGHNGEKTDTFRAFKNHKLHDPLVHPGTADLTADVNFAHIKAIAEQNDRVITFGPVEQGDFLQRMGGEIRLAKLLEKQASSEIANSLKSGYHMLTDPSQMGSRFKMFAMFPKVLEKHLQKFPVNGFSAH